MKIKQIIFALCVFLFCSPSFAQNQDSEITVCAAASLTDAMTAIADVFKDAYDVHVNLNLAGSNTLRLQIEQGAPCDIYISADQFNVEKLRSSNAAVIFQNKSILTNQLVVVAKDSNPITEFSLDDLQGDIVLADPQAVPAGVYAKEALMKAGLWPQLESSIIPAVDVRAALAQVELGNVDFGIVYKTDAMISNTLRTVYQFPEKMHNSIQYVASLLSHASGKLGAQQFYYYLDSPESQKIFNQFGFEPI